MIRELGRSLGNTVMETLGRAASRVQERRPLPVDLLESDDAYLAIFDAPGATSSDVQVRFEDSTVEVRIDRFRDFYESFDMLLPGRGLSLDGKITLPPDVNPDAASATLRQNGTLEVRVPKDSSVRETSVSESADTDVTAADEDDETTADATNDADAA